MFYYRLAAFFILEKRYMEYINGYDEYEDDFKSVSRPEYKWLAEQMLLETVENSDQQSFIELYMPDYISNDDSGYTLGDVFVLTSPDKEKGILLELKGKGCRQMESYLLAQHRSWFDFLMDTLVEGGVMKRLDLAINDMAGILDVPELTEKCNHEECISVFRSFKSYRSGELVRSYEQDRYGMGNTLYIGSLKSEVYFCIYEKDYEQYVKYDIPIEDTKIKNRFEIRLKNERAYHAVRDLLTYYDAERTAFSIINRYLRFANKEVDKRRSEWKTNDRWAYFIGSDRGRLRLTTKPEPYTLTRILNWIGRQVAPTWKVLEQIDRTNGTTYLKDILEHTRLTERHKKLIAQQTTSKEEIIMEQEE